LRFFLRAAQSVGNAGIEEIPGGVERPVLRFRSRSAKDNFWLGGKLNAKHDRIHKLLFI